MGALDIPEEDRVYIRQACELLDRRMDTIRKMDKELPKRLQSHRGKRNWRFWTPQQVEGIREWIEKTERYPGTGLPHLRERVKDPDYVTKTIHAMRKPSQEKP